MLFTIFIVAGIVTVVGWLTAFGFIIFAKDLGKAISLPFSIISWLGMVTFVITGILLLIKIAFPALGA